MKDDPELRESAERIIRNYRQTGRDPSESFDDSVILAIDYLKTHSKPEDGDEETA